MQNQYHWEQKCIEVGVFSRSDTFFGTFYGKIVSVYPLPFFPVVILANTDQDTCYKIAYIVEIGEVFFLFSHKLNNFFEHVYYQ